MSAVGSSSEPSPAANLLIAHEAELVKLEDQRVQNLETQGAALLTVVLALAAFGASVLDKDVVTENPVWVAIVVFFMLAAAGFAIAARGPASSKRFWQYLQPNLAPLEANLAEAEKVLASAAITSRDPDATHIVLESRSARHRRLGRASACSRPDGKDRAVVIAALGEAANPHAAAPCQLLLADQRRRGN